MATKKFLFGLYNLVVVKLDENGFALGQATDPDNPTPNTVYRGYRIDHPVSVTPGGASFRTATEYSGQAFKGTIQLGLENPGTVTIELAEFDHTFELLVTGGSSDSTYNTGVERGGADTLRPIPPRIGIIAYSGYASRDAATYGDLGAQGWYMVGTLRSQNPTQTQAGGENPMNLSYTFELETINKEPTGVPFSAISGLTYTGDRTVTHPISFGQYEGFIDTFVANGAATTFTLTYLPVSNSATNNGVNIIATNGVQTAVTSVNTATGLVTLSSAGTSGDIIVVWYPTAYQTP